MCAYVRKCVCVSVYNKWWWKCGARDCCVGTKEKHSAWPYARTCRTSCVCAFRRCDVRGLLALHYCLISVNKTLQIGGVLLRFCQARSPGGKGRTARRAP